MEKIKLAMVAMKDTRQIPMLQARPFLATKIQQNLHTGSILRFLCPQSLSKRVVNILQELYLQRALYILKANGFCTMDVQIQKWLWRVLIRVNKLYDLRN